MERLDTIGDSVYIVKKLDVAWNDQSKCRRVDAIYIVAVDSGFPAIDNMEDMLAEE
jgi:hypothetical protein